MTAARTGGDRAGDAAGDAVDDGEFLEIQRFLHREAALLDRRAYAEWFGLLTDDVRYVVAAQVSRPAEDGAMDNAIVDEDAASLKLRVDQIADPKLTRAENPPSLARRFVSNLRASYAAPPDSFVAETNLLVYRSRATLPDGGLYAGERRDVLRRVDGGLRIAQRRVRLDQTTLHGGSLSILL